MTSQYSDVFLLNEQKFDIAGVNGDGLFEPATFGLNPIATCTACWRGFLCLYTINDDKLILDQLHINHGKGDTLAPFLSGGEYEFQQGPEINGVVPIYPARSAHFENILNVDFFDNVYTELNLKMGFSGGILVARDFIDSLYVHMGFHPAWKYRTVFELIFDQGDVGEIRDVSKQIEEWRNKNVVQRPFPEKGASEEEIKAWLVEEINHRKSLTPGLDAGKEETLAWIESTFRLDYNFRF